MGINSCPNIENSIIKYSRKIKNIVNKIHNKFLIYSVRKKTRGGYIMFFLIPFAAAAVAATTTAISTSAIIGGAAASTAVAVGLKKYADYVEEVVTI